MRYSLVRPVPGGTPDQLPPDAPRGIARPGRSGYRTHTHQEPMSTVRRHTVPFLAAALAVLVVFPGASPHSARADDPDVNGALDQQARMQATLARQRAQLSELRRHQASLSASLTQLEADLGSVGVQLDRAVRTLERVTAQLNESRADLRSYRRQIATLEDDLVEVAAQIDQTRVDLAAREALLQDHLRAAYEQSQTSVLEVLLSSESFGEASSQLTYMLTLSDEDRILVDQIRDTREQLRIRRQTLREGRETLSDLRDTEAERAAALAVQQEQVDAARAVLKQQQRRLRELQSEQRAQLAAAARGEARTQELMAAQKRALEGQRRLVRRLKRQANKLDVAYRGRFAWPERGDFLVTQEFGSTSFNPNHTGLDMSYHTPRCGGPIYAAADGVVLADGRPAAPYDTAIGVVIGHSQRLQTWYWHLSMEIVGVGDEVKTGDLIGYEGATGVATGCHLHFQVNLDDTPQNPRNYLP